MKEKTKYLLAWVATIIGTLGVIISILGIINTNI
jgi:hypothetical protein